MFRTRVISLMQIAGHQFQRWMMETSCCTVSLTAKHVHRFCQDDYRDQRQGILRIKDTSEIEKVKSDGKTACVLDKDLQATLPVLQEQQTVESDSHLEATIDLLLSLGCTEDQIEDKIEVLNLSEESILHRATKLKELGYSTITVKMILEAEQASLSFTGKHFQQKEELDVALCFLLQCSPSKLVHLKKEHPSLTRLHRGGTTAIGVLKKAEVMRSYGISAQEIEASPEVLNVKLTRIQMRLEKLKELRDQGKLHFKQYPLNTIAERTRVFDLRVQKALQGQAELTGSAITFETIAARLGVTAKDIESSGLTFYKISLSGILQKIDILLEHGIRSWDIIRHIYIMKFTQDMIQWAVKKSKKTVDVENPSIHTILQFLSSKNRLVSQQRAYVASLLGVQVDNLSSCPEITALWSADLSKIKRNLDFLVSEGFNKDDVSNCLILLAHDSQCLRSYYHGLWERSDVAAHVKNKAWKDRKRVLSLLQYILEKDMNFRSVVFQLHDNAEYDWEMGQEDADNTGPLGKSLDFESRLYDKY